MTLSWSGAMTTANDAMGSTTDRYTAGLVYYLTNTLLLEGDYECCATVVSTPMGCLQPVYSSTLVRILMKGTPIMTPKLTTLLLGVAALALTAGLARAEDQLDAETRRESIALKKARPPLMSPNTRMASRTTTRCSARNAHSATS